MSLPPTYYLVLCLIPLLVYRFLYSVSIGVYTLLNNSHNWVRYYLESL